MTVKTAGLDLAKDVFQVHCVSDTGRKILNKERGGPESSTSFPPG
jgi:transposase